MGILKELLLLNEAETTKKDNKKKDKKPAKKEQTMPCCKPVDLPRNAELSGAKKASKVQDAPYMKDPKYPEKFSNMWFDMTRSGDLAGTIKVKK